MHFLEVRRHTMREPGGVHLSQAGVTLARRLGEDMGPFDRVITSTLPRAYETAIAMGFAVDAQLEQLSILGADVDAEVHWAAGFAAFAQAIRLGGATARFAHAQSALWQAIVESVPEGGQALVISHGGVVEAGAVACLPDADHHAWGPGCYYCEGVRLSFDGRRFVEAEILRVRER